MCCSLTVHAAWDVPAELPRTGAGAVALRCDEPCAGMCLRLNACDGSNVSSAGLCQRVVVHACE